MVDSGYSDDDVVVIESRETLSVMGGGEKPKISSSSYSYNSIWTDVKPFVHGGLAGLLRKSLQACFVLPFLPVLYHSKDPKIAAQVKKHIPSKQAYNAIFKHGATPELLPFDLSEQVNYFKTVYPTDQHTSKLPTFLLFMAKYKVPWIFKWRYHIQSDILTRQMLVKWWDTYKHQRIIDQVKQEFPVNTIATPIRAIHPSPPEVSTIRLGSPSPSIIGTSKSKTSKSKSTKLLELAQQLIAQASQASDSSSEESVTSKSPYDSLFQDAQDPFA